jgi:hypothetical protein
MLSRLQGPAIGMFANDDLVEEAKGILLYVIVPLLISILLVRLCIYIWASWRGSRWRSASPTLVSVMIGTLLLPFILSVGLMRRANSFQHAMTEFTLVTYLAFPMLVIVGSLLVIYAAGVIQRESRFLSAVIYGLCCAGSLVVEYFYLRSALSH